MLAAGRGHGGLVLLAAVFGGDEGVTLRPEGFGEGRTLDALCAFSHALGSAEQPAVILLDDCQ